MIYGSEKKLDLSGLVVDNVHLNLDESVNVSHQLLDTDVGDMQRPDSPLSFDLNSPQEISNNIQLHAESICEKNGNIAESLCERKGNHAKSLSTADVCNTESLFEESQPLLEGEKMHVICVGMIKLYPPL